MHQKDMDKLKGVSVGLLMVALVGCSKATPSLTKESVNVFADEVQAAYQGALNRPTPAPLETLNKGTAVTVLDDHYGKDYWACHVRTPSNTEGWVLCTSLNYRQGR